MPEFLQKGDWLTKIDLSLAYCHVPIAQAHRPFLRLVYDKELLQMTCLPFGLSSAPQNFAAISNWIADILRSRGIRLVVYLDLSLHCRYLQRFLSCFNQSRLRQKRIIPPRVKEELNWWLTATNSLISLHPKRISNFLTTDAADVGWGAQLDNYHLSGTWTQEQKSWHSNLKEMFAVYAVIEKMNNYLRQLHILLQTDNRTLVAYIRKEGGTKSLPLLNLTYNLLQLIDDLEITLTAAYLPGCYNGIADRLSRQRPLPEWHLLPSATKQIFNKLGTPKVDYFASKKSRVVPCYVSRDMKDHQALFTDAFSCPWNCTLGWIFPPPNLMPRVLAHLNYCRGQFLVVAPKWNQTFWMADLSNRSLEPPIEIQNLDKVLVDLTTGLPPTQVESLNLQVWKIGCGRT
ncbi:uncharacterized protein LOC122503582 [Leptopilina heterotoma]|uniref:uncharacterized protein LOC122503582 n=1 Tax=Leptopilina heterotoma TaxID=63436 RepID=UPI001CA8243D|nr:uncharacterized protein LOC122503582 [Leptopilina heterotoma]